VDKLLKSVTHGQCDARPTVTFPATGDCCLGTGTKLYCLVTEAHAGEQLAQGRYPAAKRPGVELATSRATSQRLNHCTTRPHAQLNSQKGESNCQPITTIKHDFRHFPKNDCRLFRKCECGSEGQRNHRGNPASAVKTSSLLNLLSSAVNFSRAQNFASFSDLQHTHNWHSALYHTLVESCFHSSF